VSHTRAQTARQFDRRSRSFVASLPAVASPEVVDAAGRRYSTDRVRHHLVIEGTAGDRRVHGRRGTGVGELLSPLGLAVVSGATPALTRVYVCDSWNHRIQVFDGDGIPCAMFGRRGSNAGQFDVPTDIAVVSPLFPDEDLDAGDADAALLAVADRWNHRIQIFDVLGNFITALGTPDDAAYGEQPAGFTRVGWPFFRLGTAPAIVQPVGLAWQAPRLLITTASGRIVSLDLDVALLPDFDAWQASASWDTTSAAVPRRRPGDGGDRNRSAWRPAALESHTWPEAS
jgi:hypothetical protein